MNACHFILLGLHVCTFAMFAWAVKRFFRRDRKLPRAMRWLAIVGTFVAVLQAALVPISDFWPLWTALISALLYALAMALFAWACRATWSQRLPIAFSKQSVSQLVDWGPYAVVRHPFYTSYSLAFLAGAVASMSPLAWAAAAVMVLIYWVMSGHEERGLVREVPLYLDYQRRVGRMAPSVRMFWNSSRKHSKGEIHV